MWRCLRRRQTSANHVSNAKKCRSRCKGEIHGCGGFALLLSSNENSPRPWISPLRLLLHLLALAPASSSSEAEQTDGSA